MEDDPAVLKLACREIASAGHAVLTAASAEEGLKIASDHPAVSDLLLTDVVMRGMTGIDLAERLAGARPEMAVVYMSGYAENPPSDAQRLPNGAFFIPKPFTAEQLLGALRRARFEHASRRGDA